MKTSNAAHRRKDYEIKLTNLVGLENPSQDKLRRIREGAADLTNGADWDDIVAWVKGAL